MNEKSGYIIFGYFDKNGFSIRAKEGCSNEFNNNQLAEFLQLDERLDISKTINIWAYKKILIQDNIYIFFTNYVFSKDYYNRNAYKAFSIVLKNTQISGTEIYKAIDELKQSSRFFSVEELFSNNILLLNNQKLVNKTTYFYSLKNLQEIDKFFETAFYYDYYEFYSALNNIIRDYCNDIIVLHNFSENYSLIEYVSKRISILENQISILRENYSADKNNLNSILKCFNSLENSITIINKEILEVKEMQSMLLENNNNIVISSSSESKASVNTKLIIIVDATLILVSFLIFLIEVFRFIIHILQKLIS